MTKIGARSLRWVGAWAVRLTLILFIAIEVEIWLDILVFQPEEYARLIGSESACGIVKSYCSWQAFILDNVPFMALSVLSAAALVWRHLPRRELVLGVLVVLVIAYLGWRFYRARVEASVTQYCCQDRGPSRVTMQFELLSPN
jgi:hypothetical protein